MTETAAPKTVRRTVIVTDPETEEPVTFVDGDVLPEWAAELVTNPAVFEPEESTSLDLPSSSTTTGRRFRSESVNSDGSVTVVDTDKRIVRTAAP